MSQKALSEYLVDNITNVTFANGVFRVTLSQVGKGDEAHPVVRLFIPANQFSPILNGLTRAGRNIASQLQEREGGVSVEEAADDAVEDETS